MEVQGVPLTDVDIPQGAASRTWKMRTRMSGVSHDSAQKEALMTAGLPGRSSKEIRLLE